VSIKLAQNRINLREQSLTSRPLSDFGLMSPLFERTQIFLRRLLNRTPSRWMTVAFASFVVIPLSLVRAEDSTVASTGEIRKSPNDAREYRAIRLENGLRAVVVSDPEAEKAAASLDVAIGSGSDPADRQGLAHFLEHMLFLGTEKYPDSGEYSGFIRDHGGFNNAFTSFTDTNYHFDIDALFLEPALDRFAQFFIAPLFTEDLVEREKNAVHSEFSGKRREDGRRVWDARRRAYNPEHPISQFSTGSLETLADRGESRIRDELIKFYEAHYSANIMTLAVYGAESLDDLESMVREKFSEVPNQNASMQGFDLPLYAESSLPQRLDVQALKDQRYMAIDFEVANSPVYQHTKPNQIIGHLLGHEGEGSLLSALKVRGFADSLSAGGSMSNRSAATFGINIGLTPKGLDHVDEIVEIVFGAIKLVQSDGIQKWHFDEQKRLTEIGFRFLEKSEPAALTRSIAMRLHEWPAEDVLVGPFEVSRFEPSHLRSLLNQMDPSRVMVTVVSPQAKTDLTTRFFETPYALSKIDQALIRRWTEAQPVADIRLPQANPFIPQNLDLVSEPAVEKPERLDSVDGLELWHQTDTSFSVPRANFYVSVRSEAANSSARNAVLSEMAVRMINEQLNEFTYPASLAGLGYDLYRHVRGFTCRISGYSDGQNQILSRILDAITNPQFEQESFERLRDELVRKISDTSKQPPYEQTIAEVRKMFRDPYWTDEEQIAAAQAITVKDVEAHLATLTTDVVPVAVSHGNLTRDESIARAQLVRDHLPKPGKPRDIAKPSVVKLSPGDYAGRDLAIEHNDSAVTVYVQAQDDSVQTRAHLALMTQIMSQPFYDDIRTRQQIGYFVFASQLYVMEVPGLMFAVQSPQASPEKMVGRINQFIADFSTTIQAMSEEDFERHRAAVLSRIEEPDKRLRERTERYWREIDKQEYDFDTKQKFVDAVNSSQHSDVVSLYKSLLTNPDTGRVVTWSQGKLAVENDGDSDSGAPSAVKMPAVVDDIGKFKAERERFVKRNSSS